MTTPTNQAKQPVKVDTFLGVDIFYRPVDGRFEAQVGNPPLSSRRATVAELKQAIAESLPEGEVRAVSIYIRNLGDPHLSNLHKIERRIFIGFTTKKARGEDPKLYVVAKFSDDVSVDYFNHWLEPDEELIAEYDALRSEWAQINQQLMERAVAIRAKFKPLSLDDVARRLGVTTEGPTANAGDVPGTDQPADAAGDGASS